MKIIREGLTFDDVLIVPQFSTVSSRKNVDTFQRMGTHGLKLPIISANMDTITGEAMATKMLDLGATGCLHRFQTVEETQRQFLAATQVGQCDEREYGPWVSFGLGDKELRRAVELHRVGATHFVLDVAHGAQKQVAEQVWNFRHRIGYQAYLVVGNFATASSVASFLRNLEAPIAPIVNAFKIGIGPGSACTTRIKTGCGFPQLSAILEVADLLRDYPGLQVIADGGMKTPGDIAKAFAAGAHAVMLGGMLAGTDETPGTVVIPEGEKVCPMKSYRGSASKASYLVQGKTTVTPEGESFLVPCKGSVADILLEIQGGLQSAMSYVGAHNLEQFRELARFVKVSPATAQENKAHGKG